MTEFIVEGFRSNILFQEGAKLCAAGQPASQIARSIREMNEARCTPPLPAAQVNDVIRSLIQFRAVK